jgi:hypothetical protein
LLPQPPLDLIVEVESFRGNCLNDALEHLLGSPELRLNGVSITWSFKLLLRVVILFIVPFFISSVGLFICNIFVPFITLCWLIYRFGVELCFYLNYSKDFKSCLSVQKIFQNSFSNLCWLLIYCLFYSIYQFMWIIKWLIFFFI